LLASGYTALPYPSKSFTLTRAPFSTASNDTTLPRSCRRHGINPFDYLKDLFTRHRESITRDCPLNVRSNQFGYRVPVTSGTNTLVVRASDAAGHATSNTFTLVCGNRYQFAITSPAADTSKLLVPSLRFCIIESLLSVKM
jgi:hypothetical protein